MAPHPHSALASPLLLFVLLTIPTFATSSEPDSLPAVRLSKFDEQYRQIIPSAGAGVLLGATTGADDPDHLLKPALFVPPGVYTKLTALCIETRSIDGSYYSRGELSPTDLSSHQGILRFMPASTKTRAPEGTEYASEIRRYGPSNIAVLASAGSCGSAANRNSRTFIVVDRAASTLRAQPTRQYRIYVSPGWADQVDAVYRTRTQHPVRVTCEPAQSPYSKATFSHTCRLDGPFADVTHVTVLPTKNGSPLPRYEFDLIYLQER